MLEYENELVDLVVSIEKLTDKIIAVFKEKIRLTDTELNSVSELYESRGKLINELHNRAFHKKNRVNWTNNTLFRASMDCILHKNNELNVLIEQSNTSALQRLRDFSKSQALIAYTKQQ